MTMEQWVAFGKVVVEYMIGFTIIALFSWGFVSYAIAHYDPNDK